MLQLGLVLSCVVGWQCERGPSVDEIGNVWSVGGVIAQIHLRLKEGEIQGNIIPRSAS